MAKDRAYERCVCYLRANESFYHASFCLRDCLQSVPIAIRAFDKSFVNEKKENHR